MSITSAYGWWALFSCSDGQDALRVVFWESNGSDRTGVVWNYDELKTVEDEESTEFRFCGYRYDPDSYNDHDSYAPPGWGGSDG